MRKQSSERQPCNLGPSQSAERRTHRANSIDLARDPDSTLIDWIDEQGRRQPEEAALIGAGDSLSYAALAARTTQLAATLLAAGVARQDRVGVLLEPGADLVASLLAIMRIGAIYVPLHLEWPRSRLSDIAAQVGFKTVLTSTELAAPAAALCPQFLVLEHIGGVSPPVHDAIDSRARPDDIAYILFTSGTTGQPKGIPIQHRGLLNLIASTQERYRLSAQDRVLFWTASSFDVSLLDICWPLACGAHVVLWPPAAAKQPDTAIDVIDAYGVTVFQTVPVMLDAMCDARRRKPLDRSLLRLIICGAAVLRRAVRDRALAAFGCRLANHYGPTEVAVDALWFDCAESFEGEMVPIGKPLSNVHVFVLDPDDEPLPIGVTGSICIASPGLSPGYWGAPELTEAAFFRKVFAPDCAPLRLYRTGDFGKLDADGVMHFAGREDNQVKLHGNRIELGDIESALLRHPAVAQAAVLLQPQAGGEGSLKAVVELRDRAVNRFEVRDKVYRQWTLAQQPWLRQHMNLIHHDTWPSCFEGGVAAARYWEKVYAQFPAYQYCLLDSTDNVACVGNGVPLFWDGRSATVPAGWDAGVELAFRQLAAGIAPNTVLALAGIVAGPYQGSGLSNTLVESFRALAKMHGFDQFLGPVRPVGMSEQSDMDVHAWAQARDERGEPLDFWLRVNQRLGARILGVADHSQLVQGTLKQWRRWTGVSFAASGSYALPGMLQPVEVDLAGDCARYYDPSIWVGHYGLLDASCGIDRHYGVDDLREHLSACLPAYMLPDELAIVSALPLNENGKVDFAQLGRRALADVACGAKACDPAQMQLVDIWEKTLQQSGIGIDDDFFLLGGHSLKVIEMLARVEQCFGRKVRLRDFYRQPTIYHLERLIAACEPQATPLV
ncbi:amino acid adenylation domain-containing protein [Burkholderia sp. L27(2015)]|uniref:amino acid adenylation domain-containing protein n=1 Tax=Burkholderia sp. L27(2015) TaxID=1641858 RepID=UPI00131CB744|nr:amino acid adenylation domain-containing protein [Burkholderia sp. L27(2015)]